MEFDQEPVRERTEAFLRGDLPYPGGDLNLLLMDPCSFKKGMIDVELVRIDATIEHLEQIIVEARKKLATLLPERERVEKRCKRFEKDYAKLQPGEKIPRHLLPTAKDIKSRVADYIRQTKETEAYFIPVPKTVEGWHVIHAAVKTDKFKFSMKRKEPLPLESLALPKIEGWEFDNAEIDSFGTLNVEMRVPYKRPDLGLDSVVESALRGIDSYAAKFEAGEIVQKSAEAVVAFHENQHAIMPAFARELHAGMTAFASEWEKRAARTVANVQTKWVEPHEQLDSS